MALQKGSLIRRNDRCPCGSGRKFKMCCSPAAPALQPISRPRYIDTGAVPVRWLIMDRSGTQFFADKDNRALVFTSYGAAAAVASMEEFHEQESGEINVAGVGEAKFELLKAKIPYIEIADVAEAVALVRERIDYGKAGELLPSEPLDIFQQPNEDKDDGRQDCQSESAAEGAKADQAPEQA